MVKHISTLSFLVIKVLHKCRVNQLHVLHILNAGDIQLGVSFGEGFGVKNADVLRFEILLAQAFEVAILLIELLLPEEFDPVEGVDFLEPVTGFGYSNMEETSAEFGIVFDKAGDIFPVEDTLKHFPIIGQPFECDRSLYFPQELVNFPVVYSQQQLLSLSNSSHKILISLIMFQIQELNPFQYPVSQLTIFHNPIASLFDVSTNLGELVDWLDLFQNVHNHELNSLRYVVQVVCFV